MIKSESVDRISPSQTMALPIVETFHSVQGEGAWAGTNAFFIRLGGCDVGCWFCDTKESWNLRRHPQQEITELVADAIAANPAIVVITGGEPLMHDLTEVSGLLHKAGLRVHLETSGAHPFSGQFDWVTLSPKVSKPPHESVYAHASELKIVVANSDDLTWAEQQSARVSATVIRYLQAEWNTLESRDLIFDYVLRHSNWRISVQTHKLLGVR